MGRGFSHRRVGSVPMEVQAGGPAPIVLRSSGVMHRNLDPAIARQIRDIDPRLVIEWAPEGIWWTPVSQVPPGATLGCWRLMLRGDSGLTKTMRMWHPECADGRLVNYLTETWAHKLFISRSETATQRTKAEKLAEVYARQQQAEQREFDRMWDEMGDHGETYVSAVAMNESPKWRSNWGVPRNLPESTDEAA